MTEPEQPRPTSPGNDAPNPRETPAAPAESNRIGRAMASVVRRTERSLSPWARQMLLAPPEDALPARRGRPAAAAATPTLPATPAARQSTPAPARAMGGKASGLLARVQRTSQMSVVRRLEERTSSLQGLNRFTNNIADRFPPVSKRYELKPQPAAPQRADLPLADGGEAGGPAPTEQVQRSTMSTAELIAAAKAAQAASSAKDDSVTARLNALRAEAAKKASQLQAGVQRNTDLAEKPDQFAPRSLGRRTTAATTQAGKTTDAPRPVQRRGQIEEVTPSGRSREPETSSPPVVRREADWSDEPSEPAPAAVQRQVDQPAAPPPAPEPPVSAQPPAMDELPLRAPAARAEPSPIEAPEPPQPAPASSAPVPPPATIQRAALPPAPSTAPAPERREPPPEPPAASSPPAPTPSEPVAQRAPAPAEPAPETLPLRQPPARVETPPGPPAEPDVTAQVSPPAPIQRTTAPPEPAPAGLPLRQPPPARTPPEPLPPSQSEPNVQAAPPTAPAPRSERAVEPTAPPPAPVEPPAVSAAPPAVQRAVTPEPPVAIERHDELPVRQPPAPPEPQPPAIETASLPSAPPPVQRTPEPAAELPLRQPPAPPAAAPEPVTAVSEPPAVAPVASPPQIQRRAEPDDTDLPLRAPKAPPAPSVSAEPPVEAPMPPAPAEPVTAAAPAIQRQVDLAPPAIEQPTPEEPTAPPTIEVTAPPEAVQRQTVEVAVGDQADDMPLRRPPSRPAPEAPPVVLAQAPAPPASPPPSLGQRVLARTAARTRLPVSRPLSLAQRQAIQRMPVPARPSVAPGLGSAPHRAAERPSLARISVPPAFEAAGLIQRVGEQDVQDIPQVPPLTRVPKPLPRPPLRGQSAPTTPSTEPPPIPLSEGTTVPPPPDPPTRTEMTPLLRPRAWPTVVTASTKTRYLIAPSLDDEGNDPEESISGLSASAALVAKQREEARKAELAREALNKKGVEIEVDEFGEHPDDVKERLAIQAAMQNQANDIAVDYQDVARRVYPILRRLLAIDRERR